MTQINKQELVKNKKENKKHEDNAYLLEGLLQVLVSHKALLLL